MTKILFPNSGERATQVLELVHTNVRGPINVLTSGRYEYSIIFINAYYIFGYVYQMRHKSKSFNKLKEFRAEVEKAREIH